MLVTWMLHMSRMFVRLTEARVCPCVCSRENICPGVGGGLGRRGQVQAAGVCRVKGLQLLIAGWYTDTDGGVMHQSGCD